MGFQLADLEPFAAKLGGLEGVSGVWLLTDEAEKTITMIVAVRGLDEPAHGNRMTVRDEIERYMAAHADEMKHSHLVFDYRLTVDEPRLGPLPIPSGAQQVAVAI